jgi:hypothetical protein
LAASAVDIVVLGPGVKLIKVAKVSSAASSSADIGAVYGFAPAQNQYTLSDNTRNCAGREAGT